MVDITIRHKDGHKVTFLADSIEEARGIVEAEAICTAENTHPVDIDAIFPMSYTIKDEHGEIHGRVNEEGWMLK